MTRSVVVRYTRLGKNDIVGVFVLFCFVLQFRFSSLWLEAFSRGITRRGSTKIV